MEILTNIKINANPKRVWEVFTHFQSYPEWNPFIKALNGNPKVGSIIEVNLPGMKFKPVVLNFSENKELRWKGKLLFNGVFDGEHFFQLVDNGDGTTTFKHGERFTGFLVRLFRKKIENETKAGFQAMNQALKDRVEQTGN
mgnify:CR=1 FL=1